MLIDKPQITEGSFIINAAIAAGTTDPSSPDVGELFFNTGSGALRIYTGSAWQSLRPLDTSGNLNLSSGSITAGAITGTTFSGAGTGLTGTAAGLSIGGNAGTASALATSRTFSITGAAVAAAQSFNGTANVVLTVTDLNASNLTGGTVPAARLSGTYTIGVSGNASTATALATARTVGLSGVAATAQSFDGTANITIPVTAVPATLLTGTVPTGNLTGTYAISVSGNAATASALTPGRTINGVLFDGTANITVADSTKLPLSGGTLTGTLNGTTITAATIAATSTLTVGGSAVATQSYVDNLLQGVSWKNSVRVATTANITLSGTQTIDGIAVITNDRVLVKNQTAQAQNGIYLVSTSAWSRAPDADLNTELEVAAVFVREGTTLADTAWVQINPITTLGTSPVAFTQFASAAGLVAGQGITVSGTIVSVLAGNGLSFSGSNLTINASTDFSVGTQLALAATPGAPAGTYGSSTTIPVITTDGRGRITSISTQAVSGTQAASPLLTAISNLSTNGLVTRTSSTTAEARALAVSGVGLSVTNADGASGNPTITSNATNVNAGSTIVARDASGNFSAGTISASLSGAASLNVLKAGDTMTGPLVVSTGSGSPTATPFIDAQNGSNFGVFLAPRLGAGSWNPFTQTNDSALIFRAGATADLSAALIIAPWSTSSSGIRINHQGTVSLGSGFRFMGVTPSTNLAWLTTPQYGISQGDNCTHFGYNTGSSVGNYIRGAFTNIDSPTTNIAGSTTISGGFAANSGATISGSNLISNVGVRAAYGTPTGDSSLFGYAFSTDGDSGLFANGTAPGATNVSLFMNSIEMLRLDSGGLTLRTVFGAQPVTISTNPNAYGSISISGSNNGYAGVQFPATANQVTLMARTSDNLAGMYQASNSTWQWYYDPSIANIRIAGANPVLHAGNFNSYSPTLTGTGASGTWAINITGNAATATSASSAGSATATQALRFYDGTSPMSSTSSQASSGGRAVDLAPQTYKWGVFADFKNSGTVGVSGNYAGLLTVAPWDGTSASTGDPNYQLSFSPAGANSILPPTLRVRAGIDSSWGVWSAILHSSNYNSYAPTLTGGGASGTWTINITGNSATTTLASKSSTLSQNGGNGAAMTFNWAGQSGQPTWLWGSNDGVNHYVWNPSNFSVNYANSAGSAAIASNVSSISSAVGSAYTWTGQQSFVSSSGVGVNGASGTCMPQSAGGATAATISFHRVGIYGLNMGLDTDNVFRIGGWSDGLNTFRMSLDASGNLAVRGNVTGFLSSLSDRRLKQDIKPITGALEKVERLQGVTYEMINSGERQVGLIAQDVEEVVREVVREHEGYKTVAYGNLVALLVEAIKELKAEIQELKKAKE